MTAPGIDALDDGVLHRWYDAGSLARGRAYADEDRVRLLGVEPFSIKAVCRGSGSAAYLVRIRWSTRAGRIDVDDQCSCPLGGACKHCVATIVVARREWARPGTPRDSGGGEWRRAFVDLAVDAAPADDPPPTRPSTAPTASGSRTR